jgi:hypothetical protein
VADQPIDRFLRGFVTPLITGGHVHIDGVLGPGALDDLVSGPKGMNLAQADGKLMADAVNAARMQLARFGPTTDFVTITEDAIGLCAVWHNLIAMTHPDAVTRTGLRQKVREWTAQFLEWVGPPRTAQEIAMRHAVLARLEELGRVDTDVTFWAGSARYIGVLPPNRLTAWKSVRRVNEQKTRHDLFTLLATLAHPLPEFDLLPLADHALALSPLTDLALCDRPDAPLPFRWTGASLAMLADDALRGAAMRVALTSEGNTPDAIARRVAMIDRATMHAMAIGAPPTAVGILIAFHLELLVSEALARGAPPPGQALAYELVARLGPERTAHLCRVSTQVIIDALRLDERPIRAQSQHGPGGALLARAGIAEVSP